DEMVTARELVPNTKPPAGGAMFGAMPMPGPKKGGAGGGNKMVLLVTKRGEAPADLVNRVHKRYGTKLTRSALGLDEATFAALDTNKDGVLDAAELAGFVKRSPDVELLVRLGYGSKPGVDVVKGQPAPLADKLSAAHGVALLDLGSTRVEVRGAEKYQS